MTVEPMSDAELQFLKAKVERCHAPRMQVSREHLIALIKRIEKKEK